ncbi:acyltransferase family protein [Novosphingobium lindaniclasticum]
MSHIRYRRDIDGLRTIAVLPVVLYHAELPPFSGGFVGVDIFFVISGFLITSGLLKDANEQKFSLLAFYDRRIRRILPALLAVTMATLAYGTFVMLPGELLALGKSAVSVALFSSNIWFWSQLNYFGPAPYESPLLHSWSLAVEEQFYIFWPLVVALFTLKPLRRWFLPAIVAAIVISFGLSEFIVHKSPNFAFYMFPTRAWELLLGALLAVAPSLRIPNPALRLAAALAGLGLVLVPMLTYTGATLFPGLSALPVCVGTALLLLANAEQDNVVARLLGSGPMVFVGKLSYSLYLWHWPVIAFFWLQRGAAPSPVEGALLVAASFVLSYLSLRYVEAPFRQRSSTNIDTRIVQRRVVAFGALALLAIGLASAPLIVTRGLPGRLPQPALLATEFSPKPFTPEIGCALGGSKGIENCAKGIAEDDRSTVVLWGDSHARALGFGFTKATEQAGIPLRTAVKSSCSPLPGTLETDGTLVADDSCRRFNEMIFEAIRSNPHVKTVVIAGRWARFVNDSAPGSNEAITSKFLLDEQERVAGPEQTKAVLQRSLERVISRFGAAGKEVLLVEQAPSFPDNARKCVARSLWRGKSAEDCSVREADVRRRRLALTTMFEDIAARHDNVRLIDPLPVMCRGGLCPADDRGLPLYADEHHVTERGSAREATSIPLRDLRS